MKSKNNINNFVNYFWEKYNILHGYRREPNKSKKKNPKLLFKQPLKISKIFELKKII